MGLFYWLVGFVGDRISVVIWAMLIACLLPFVWAILAKILGGFKPSDNQNPRLFLDNLTGLPARANAAQANSFETLPMFLASVLMAMYCFVPQFIVNGLACFYVILRILYGLAYLGNVSALRSIFWTASMACIVMLFVLSIRMVG